MASHTNNGAMSDQVKYTNKLKDAHVLVVGGSSGMGFAAAEAAIEEGARVTISSSNQKRIDEAISALKQSYPSASSRITGYPCDLGDEATLEQNVQALFRTVGKVDHVIYTAGDPVPILPIQEVTVASFKQAGMVRFFAPMIVVKEAMKYMSTGPESSITLTAGMIADRPTPGFTVIGSYAGGLHSMVRGLALDMKPIRVNAISPGPVATKLFSPGPIDTNLLDQSGSEDKKRIFEEMAKTLATAKFGRAEDIAHAYMYALKDHNLTGSIIRTDGGMLLG